MDYETTIVLLLFGSFLALLVVGRTDHRCARRVGACDLPLSRREPHQVRADRLHLGGAPFR